MLIFGLMAMHSKPSKSSVRSTRSIGKKLSFAIFQNYPACRGYRYPATQNCIQTAKDAGYSIPRHERVVIHPTLPVNLRWTSTRPSISFGTVQDLLSSTDRAPPSSGGNHGSLIVDIPGHVGSSSVCATGREEHTSFGPLDRAEQDLSPGPVNIPSSQQAREDFDDLISGMVEEVHTCQICLAKEHFSSACTSKLWFLSCCRVGHVKKDCNKFARILGWV